MDETEGVGPYRFEPIGDSDSSSSSTNSSEDEAVDRTADENASW